MKKNLIFIFIFITTITVPCLGMKTIPYKAPIKPTRHTDTDNYTTDTDAYTYESKRLQSNGQNKLNVTTKIATTQDDAIPQTEIAEIIDSSNITLLSESQNKNLSGLPLTIRKASIDYDNLPLDATQKNLPLDNDGLVLAIKENPTLVSPFNQNSIDIKNNKNAPQKRLSNVNQSATYNKQNKFIDKNTEDDNSSSNFSRLLSGFINKSLFLYFNQQHLMSADINFSEISLDESFLEGFIEIIFTMEEKLQTIQNHDFDNFKMQIQYLAQEITKYNTTSVYNNIDQMLLFIKFMNQFLKGNKLIHLSQEMAFKLDDVLTTSSTCCDIIRNQNIILSKKSTPDKVISFFQPHIDRTNQLSDFSDYYKTIHDIYDANGNIDRIIQGWKKFQSSRLSKTSLNRQYGAFITFLLLFENSIIATAIILDESSTLYKIPVKITMQSNT